MSYKYEDIRNFYFENELGERIDCQKIDGNLFFYNVTGLGYEEEIEYVQIGNKFIPNRKKIKQNQIAGDLEFYNMTYDEYCEFVDFILRATSLKLIYVPKKTLRTEYYRDIDLFKIDKSEEDEYNILSCPIIMNCKSLWYEEKNTKYEITAQDDEIRWDFRWDSRFLSNNSNVIDFNNKGHAPARVVIEIEGYIVNPTFIVEQNGKTLYELPITTTVDIGEKLIFSSLENDFYIKKVNMVTDEETDLYTLDNIDFNKDYILTLPIGESSLTIETDDILNQATVNIYSYYKAT